MQEFKMFGFKCYYLDRITLLEGGVYPYQDVLLYVPLWRKMQQEKKAQRR